MDIDKPETHREEIKIKGQAQAEADRLKNGEKGKVKEEVCFTYALHSTQFTDTFTSRHQIRPPWKSI